MSRESILKNNHALRIGVQPAPRKLDSGEVVFRIPESDMKALASAFPELVSKDNSVRLAAWHKLRSSPLGEKYMVTRTPRQVKNSPGGIIIK